MKKICITLILLFCFALPAAAEEVQEPYSQQLELSGANELDGLLSDGARDIMDGLEIDLNDKALSDKLTAKNLFEQIWDFLHTGGRAPMRCGLVMLALILITGAFEGIRPEGEVSAAVEIVCVAAMAANVLIPLYSLIQSTAAAVRAGSVFMTGFIPVFAGIITLGGGAATSAVMSGTLLAAAQCVSWFSGFVVTPLMSAYLAVSACGAVSPAIGRTGLGDAVKRVAMWIYALGSTVFLGLLSIQTTLSGAADSLALRTSRFVIGSLVPVAGSALSEALGTLCGSVGILKSTVGMYGVIAVAATVAPVCIELLLYRFWLFSAGAAAQLFGQKRIVTVIKAADNVLALLTGVVLFSAALFIICLTVVVKTGGQSI